LRASLDSEIGLLRDAEKYLYAVNMGATAIGTGINAPKGYAQKTAQHWRSSPASRSCRAGHGGRDVGSAGDSSSTPRR
jgi:aspartate ammonia-lyase